MCNAHAGFRIRDAGSRFSRPLSGVGVIPMTDAGLDTTRHVDIPQGVGVLHKLVPGMAVGVLVDCHWVGDGVEVLR